MTDKKSVFISRAQQLSVLFGTLPFRFTEENAKFKRLYERQQRFQPSHAFTSMLWENSTSNHNQMKRKTVVITHGSFI